MSSLILRIGFKTGIGFLVSGMSYKIVFNFFRKTISVLKPLLIIFVKTGFKNSVQAPAYKYKSTLINRINT